MCSQSIQPEASSLSNVPAVTQPETNIPESTSPDPTPKDPRVAQLRAAAVDAVSRGFAILTCGRAGTPEAKDPWGFKYSQQTGTPNYSPNAVNSASRIPETAFKVWNDGQDANYGVACGPSNLTVIDVDSGISNVTALKQWMEAIGLPETLTVQTGRDTSFGAHLYFSGAVKTTPFQIEGVTGELRGIGSYVVGPNCVHPSGKRYTIINDVPIAPLPEGIVALANKNAKQGLVFKPGELIRENTRWIYLRSRAGTFRNTGLDRDGIYNALKNFAVNNCEDGTNYPDYKIQNLADWAASPDCDVSAAGVVYFGDGKNPELTPTQIAMGIMLKAKWFQPVPEFLAKKFPPKKFLVTDKTGQPVLTSSSINQIFAFRGTGKSLLGLGLIDIMLNGGELLGYKSPGGFKVLLCDGELPPEDLQARLTELVHKSDDKFTLMSPNDLPNLTFPPLSGMEYQRRFLEQVDELKPDVIVFDTLSACFKFDTNDADTWILVNQFLLELRFRGICVILTHHAGKNGTQRGRTDGDDNLDLVMKLDYPTGHTAGMGLNFVLSYEKVRANSRLAGFQAVYDHGWEIVVDVERESIIEALKAGKTYEWIKENLDVKSDKDISDAKKYAVKNGLLPAGKVKVAPVTALKAPKAPKVAKVKESK